MNVELLVGDDALAAEQSSITELSVRRSSAFPRLLWSANMAYPVE